LAIPIKEKLIFFEDVNIVFREQLLVFNQIHNAGEYGFAKPMGSFRFDLLVRNVVAVSKNDATLSVFETTNFLGAPDVVYYQRNTEVKDDRSAKGGLDNFLDLRVFESYLARYLLETCLYIP
jgi:hypothetical protein